ncbi:MAG TPA: shikimate kinase [Spirochaetia bacterium]|nr:shikimate kinase [Spirochaetia bacterium]
MSAGGTTAAHSAAPPLIALIGFMGSGKSTVGRIVAEKVGYRFVDTDALVVERAGAPISRIFAERGEAAFRDLEAQVLRSLSSARASVIAAGGGAPAQQRNRQFFQNARTFHLRVSFRSVRGRTREDTGRPLLSQDDHVVRGLYEGRLAVYEELGEPVETDGRTPLEVAEEIILRLRSPRQSRNPADRE